MAMLDVVDRKLTHAASRLRAMDDEALAELAEHLDGLPVPGVRMTQREFIDWSLFHVDAEWVDGEVILMAPGNIDHETLDKWIGRLIGNLVEEQDLGTYVGNMFVRFAGLRRLRVPDA